jgi:hypothetical protein
MPRLKLSVIFLLPIFLLCLVNSADALTGGFVQESTIAGTISELKEKYGESHSTRIQKGVEQVANFWRVEDGSDDAFASFCREYFISDPTLLESAFQRFETNLEVVNGHSNEIGRDLSRQIQLDIGPILPVDYLFAEYDPTAHLNEDFFKTKIAFVVLLNFPLTTLEERLQSGLQWTREQWAQTRLAQVYAQRVPANVQQELAKAYVQADDYIGNYNVYMHNLVDSKGERLFPQGLKLISHWGLRDELKAQYAKSDGLARQQMIQKVMERIIRQEIPQQVIDSDKWLWNPLTNQVFEDGQKVQATPEENSRYQHLLSVFQAEHLADPYYPNLPTKMDRRFKRDREIPEQEFEKLLVSVLTDPAGKDVARLISKRLKRKLVPFDIWYNGFKPRGAYDESELDKIVTQRYSDLATFQADLPNILDRLGFEKETAQFLAGKVIVDPSRGAGHAMGAGRREDKAHLRTRVPQGGMNYKGYNIAIHEFGHNVEQVFSLNRIDHYLLMGVPNTAFTEAFAFVFQSRDLELLGLSKADPLAEHLKTLDTYWATCEIAAVGLVDMRVWHWMYDHPQADPQELKEAVIRISQEVWNQYWAPLIGVKDVILLGVYSHMIDAGLYLPDYSLGHIIMFQIEQHLKGKNLGIEMERMCTLGSITPDAWMRAAVGGPISAQPLLTATQEALKAIK